MRYALVIDNAVQNVGRLPDAARRLDTRQWVLGLSTAPAEFVEACGYFPVVDTPPAYDSRTEVLERGDVVLVDRVPTVAYTVRAKTAEELAAEAEAAHVAGRQAAAERAARLVVVDRLTADLLDDDTISEVAPLFDRWAPGLAVRVGDVLAWDGTLVECIQAHTTQADWAPGVTPALWRVFRTPDMTEWVAGIAVSVNEVFTYQGVAYRCLQAHTTQIGWEPPKVPALWAVQS
jgi:hypothetical protein